MAETVFIDGTALAASSFGQTDTSTNRWIPKAVSGLTFGTEGYYLNFSDSLELGDDTSGNTNDWAENNMTATNQTIDTPTKNFATFNPATPQSAFAYSEGNLKAVGTTSASHKSTLTTIAVTGGKWYYEHTVTALSGAPSEGYYVGIQPASGAGSLML